MLEELRISSLGVIESSTLDLGPGLTVITGETGAGKTMVVTALGLLLGGRADPGAVRTGSKPGARRGQSSSTALAGFRARLWRTPAARSRTTGSCSRATSRPRAVARLRRRRLGAGDRARRDRRAAGRGARPVRPAPAAPGDRAAAGAGPLRRAGSQSSPRLRRYAYPTARGRARRDRHALLAPLANGPARPTTPVRARRDRGRRPQTGEDIALAAEETRLGFADTLRIAAEHAREALSSEDGTPDALATRATPRGASRASVITIRQRASWPIGSPSSATCWPTSPATSRRTPRPRHRPGAARRVRERRSALIALDPPKVRRHHRRGPRLGQGGRDPVARPRRHRRAIDELDAERRDDSAPEQLGALAAGLSTARPAGRRSARRSRTSSRSSPCRTRPRDRGPSPAGGGRRRAARGGRGVRGSAHGVDDVEFLLAANTGTEARPWPRVRPVASCRA